MRLAPLALALLALAPPVLGPGPSLAQTGRRGVPRAVREALVGCWDLGDGEVHVIEPHGARGLRSRWMATGEAGVERYAESMFYRPDDGVVEGGCGARSQHGQFCLFRPTDDGAEVSLISRYSGRVASVRAAHPCAEGVTVEEPSSSVEPVPADGPLARLLGARRRAIEAARTPTGEADGWVRYGDGLAIRYEAGVAMAVRAVLAADDCDAAARAAGFSPPPGTAPLRRSDGCEWPGLSARHRLAPHVGARWQSGVLELWRR